MKVVILAGGRGTRLSEETDMRPKPMVQIGGHPILWHIMKHYSFYGFHDFVILLGYKGHYIEDYVRQISEPWNITLVDTGLETMTGGRVKRVEEILKGERFMLTYGDGVSDVNIKALLKFHEQSGAITTLTTVQPESRFGVLDLDGNVVKRFIEKPKDYGPWINGGFFVCEPEVFPYISEGDSTIFERTPLENLAHDRKLMAYKHEGFWKSMDTLRDKIQLDQMWNENKAPWKVWSE